MIRFFKPLTLMALGLAVAAGGMVAPVSSSTVSAAELKIAHFMSPRHPMDSKIMRPWAEEVKKMSGGSLAPRVYPGGELGKGPVAQFKRVVDGVADITFGLQGYTSKLFPRTTMSELPILCGDSVDCTGKVWKAIKQIAPEYKRVKILGIWTTGTPILMTKSKPIRSIDDIKGMKIRTPSKAQAALIKALGATPVAMPITKAYNSLNTGVVDALMVPPSVIRSFKIGEVAKYYTLGLPFGNSPQFLLMNKKSYDGLSAAHKALVDKTTGEALSMKAAKVYVKAEAGGLKMVTGTGKHEIIKLSAAEVAKGRKLLEKARAAQVTDLEKKGIPAKAILKAMGSM